MGTNFVMGPPPYPLEWILRDATAPGGAYHGNYGHETSVIVDYPFVTGRSTPDSYLTGPEDGRGARERPQAVGVPPERRRRGELSGARGTEDGPLRDRRAVARRRDHVHVREPRHGRAGVPGRARRVPRHAVHHDAAGDDRGRDGRRLRPRDAEADARPAAQRRRARQRDRDDVPGEAGRRPARRDRRRVGRPLRLDGRADGRRPRLDGAAGDQVVDARDRSVLDAARAAAGDQDRRHAADAGPSSSRCRWTCSTRSSSEEVVPTSFPDTRVGADRRGGRAARSAMLAGASRPIVDHRRRHRVLGRAGRADPRRRAARRRGLGRELLRGQHRRRPSALPRPARAHVRRPQQGDHLAGRRGADLRHVRLPRGVPRARGRVRAAARRSCTSTSTPTRSRRTSRSTSASSPTRSSRSACSPTSSSAR